MKYYEYKISFHPFGGLVRVISQNMTAAHFDAMCAYMEALGLESSDCAAFEEDFTLTRKRVHAAPIKSNGDAEFIELPRL